MENRQKSVFFNSVLHLVILEQLESLQPKGQVRIDVYATAEPSGSSSRHEGEPKSNTLQLLPSFLCPGMLPTPKPRTEPFENSSSGLSTTHLS